MIFLSLLLLSLIGLIKSEEKISYYMEKINEMQNIIDPIFKKCPREYLINELGEKKNSEKVPVEFEPKKNLCRTMENLNKLFANAKEEFNKLLEIFAELRSLINDLGGLLWLENLNKHFAYAKKEYKKLLETFTQIRNEILSNDLGELLIHYAKFFNEHHVKAIYDFIKKIWNNGTKITRRHNLNEHIKQLFYKLKTLPSSDPQKNEIILEMLFTGNRMGISAFNDNPLEKLEWALQQFAVNLFVYRMELPKEMFPAGDIKFPIGMKP